MERHAYRSKCKGKDGSHSCNTNKAHENSIDECTKEYADLSTQDVRNAHFIIINY